MSKIIFRQFIYLDSKLVADFLSTVEGGIYDEEQVTTQSAKSGNAGGGANIMALKVEAGGSLTSSHGVEKVVRQSESSSFDRLYEYLKKEKAITVLTKMDSKAWSKLEDGEIVEVRATGQLAGLSKIFSLASAISKSAPAFKMLGANIDNEPAIEGISAMAMASDSSSVVAYVASSPEYKFLAKLPSEHISGSAQELEGEYTIVGKIQRKLNDGEEVPAAQLLPGFEGLLKAESYREIAANTSSTPDGLQLGPMVVEAPAAILTPIAIYR